MSFAHHARTTLCAFLMVLGGCVSAPPPMPMEAGKIKGEPLDRGVTWVSGIDTGGPVYGPCNRVLSIDGGGVRGIIPALMLEEIEKETGQPISKLFDSIVGTSTGAILALGLTRPDDKDAHKPAFRASELVAFYEKNGPEIFPHTFTLLRRIRQLFSPKYGSREIEEVLEDSFSDVYLDESLTRVLIPAYEIEERRRIWFDSYDFDASHFLMRDVLRGATAAPTYLPPFRLAAPITMSTKGYLALVDGGVFANNPAITAMSNGITLLRGGDGGDFLLLSLGTGTSHVKLSFDKIWGWGELEWLDTLLDIAFSDPAIEKDSKVMESKEKYKYVRLQVELDEADLKLDDTSLAALGRLKKSTKKYLADNHEEIQSIATRLMLPRRPECEVGPGPDREPRPIGARQHRLSP